LSDFERIINISGLLVKVYDQPFAVSEAHRSNLDTKHYGSFVPNMYFFL